MQLVETAEQVRITHTTTTGKSESAYNCQILEALHGGELFYHIVRNGPFSRPTARGFLRQLISGVAAIHEIGYIHRDLKPWNIILSDDHSQVKIIDFGLATPLDKSSRQMPFTSFLPGTRQYMAPENIVTTRSSTSDLSTTDLSKVDSFALGVILINMLTGGYLFESCLAPEFEEIINDEELFCSALREKIPGQICEAEIRDLTRLIRRMLQPGIDERLSIEELQDKEHPDLVWLLDDSAYLSHSEVQIAYEMHERVKTSESLNQVLLATRSDGLSTRSGESSEFAQPAQSEELIA